MLFADRLNCSPEMVDQMKHDWRLSWKNIWIADRLILRSSWTSLPISDKVVNMLRQYRLKDYKFSLVLMTTILSVIGILVIGSANSSYQRPQTLGLILGLILMVIVS